jgi:hypothetical protein
MSETTDSPKAGGRCAQAHGSAEIHAKLAERRTVHLWLNDLGTPRFESTGKRMCLLRRLSVQLGITPLTAPSGGEHCEAGSPAPRRIRCGSMGGIDCVLELGHSGPCQTKYDLPNAETRRADEKVSGPKSNVQSPAAERLVAA